MSQNSNTYNISNEQLLLINILNGMYNDNLRQINNLNQNITTINESNTQIRNILVQILNVSNNRRNNNFRNNQRSIPTQYIFPIRQTSRTNSNENNNITQLFDNFFEPIEIFPTQSQIESATRCVRYCDIISPINRTCPISLENFTDNDMVSVIRHCGHIFNTEQLNIWFRSNCKCPICRYDIRNYNANAFQLFRDNTPYSRPSNQSNSSSETAASTVPQNNIREINSSISNILFNNTIDISGNYINNTTQDAYYYLLTIMNELNNNNNRNH